MGRSGRLCGFVLAAACCAGPAWAQGVPGGALPGGVLPGEVLPGGAETAALASLREAEHAADPVGRPGSTVAEAAARSGTALGGTGGIDPAFAARVQLPTIPVRMSPRLVRALGLYRDDVRARRVLSQWVRHASRYQGRMETVLLAEGVPADLVWVAAAESGFEPRAESGPGAGGAWQLMPEAARTYGLRVDTWVDERRDPEKSTRAAARYLRDLYGRFGTWELALAAYNMGYNALLRSMRKYNTNDFEALADLEAGLPWETVHYVPRILAAAVAAHNPGVFDLGTVPRDPVETWDDVAVPGSVFLADVAREAGVDEAALRALNPALLRSRTPGTDPGGTVFTLHVPAGRRDAVVAALSRLHSAPARAYALRYGETVDEVAARYGLRARALLAMSGLSDDRAAAPGVVFLTPDRDPVEPAPTALPVVPMDTPGTVPAGRTRVFVRVLRQDDLGAPAHALGVSRTDLAGWNALDPAARLQPGMWLQAWVPGDPSGAARVWREADVELVRRGSEFFHDHAVAATGLVRIRVTARDGDTLASLADRYATTPGRLARINHRDRRAPVSPGDTVIVYTDPAHAGTDAVVTPGPLADDRAPVH